MYNWGMKTHATYQVRAYTTAKGYARLERVTRMCALLYNAALREWRDAYRQAGVSRSYVDQFKELTLIRRDDPSGWGSLSVHVGTRRVDAPRQGEEGVLPPGRTRGNTGLPQVQDTQPLEDHRIGGTGTRDGDIGPYSDKRPANAAPPQ